jgi:glycerate kinase
VKYDKEITGMSVISLSGKQAIMKKIILIPDSFKGTLSSIQVCNILEKQIRKRFEDAKIIKIPVADGGEGSVDAFLQAVGGEKVFVEVNNPYMEKMNAFYGLIENGQCAVIEMAACAGLPLVEDRKDPTKTTTYGVGELIRHALGRGVKKIIVGLGGSCTNDGGTGCAAALGVRFTNRNGKDFIPVGGTLSEISHIDTSGLDKRLKDMDIITMCDIDNPLYGKEGAAYVFSPQKGADADMVAFLDGNLKTFAEAVAKDLGFGEWHFKGAGAAGGMGFGMKVFFNSKIQMGIETVLDVVNFNEIIKGADYVITGEGKLDYQSLRGKVVIGVSRRAKKMGIKVIAVVGVMGEGAEGAYNEGVNEIVVTNYLDLPFEQVKKRAEQDMIHVVSQLVERL